MFDMRMMEVTAAEAEPGYVVDLTFSDGTKKRVCLRPLLSGDAFEPMLDERVFGQLRVDDELGTITWPNCADLAPETLYSLPEMKAERLARRIPSSLFARHAAVGSAVVMAVHAAATRVRRLVSSDIAVIPRR
jgi:hypothetical protein